jgi:exopolysaccharide biosynthesis polyprenyl glycosylphosphotransferase
MKAETAIEGIRTADRVKNRVPVWGMPAIKAVVIIADAAIALFSFVLAFKLRQGDAVLSLTAWAWSQEFVPYAGILYFAVPVRIAMLLYQRVFRYHGAFSYAQEAFKIFKAVAVSSLLIIAWAFLFRGGFAFRDFSYSRSVFVIDFAIAVAAYLIFHLALRFAQVRARNRGINLIPTLIVGTNSEAGQTIRELRERRDLGYRVVGVLEGVNGEHSSNSHLEADVSILGTIDDLPSVVRELAIQEVIITDNTLSSDRLFESMMKIGRKQRVEFRFAPSLFELLPQKTSVDQIGVLPMVRLFREPLSDAERLLKRVSDIVISLLAIFILLPVFFVITVWVRLDSRGRVFFRQERVGMDGRIFLCYKFRTMRSDSDEEVHRDAYRKNIEGDENANAGNDDEPVFGKVRDDQRITRAGRFLRRSSLDELPQLFNVLKGDMSIVGPRPPIPYEVEAYETWHRKRLDMKPGITGLWQVSGRNRLTFEEMVRIDLFYIENWSLWFDLKIILLTLPAVFRGDGAR